LGRGGGLGRFVLLYALLFAGFGVASPFLGAFLGSRGLRAEVIGLVLAAGTAARLIAGPFFGGLADRLAARRTVLTACSGAACFLAFCFLPARGMWVLLGVFVVQSAALAPITAIADALVVAAAPGRFDYGWVRGVGSGAFILGTLVAGRAVAAAGLDSAIWLHGVLLGLAAVACAAVPDRLGGARIAEARGLAGLLTLLRLPSFARMMVVAALVQGSHAMHDGFVVIHWRALGIGDGTIGVLWSESVAAEVVVFLLIGPWLLNRLGPGGASVLAAVGGIVRWGVLANTSSAVGAALVEPLHGLTFALQHLACIRLIGAVVPAGLAATSQAFYGTFVVGLTTTAMMLGSGVLYARIGAAGFWVMAGFCALAVPVAARLRQARQDRAV
jgi:PPP family 3-phenylpropionic acid transporter